jgi:hypothetical protein
MTARAVTIDQPSPSLRVLRSGQAEADIVMLVNESTRDVVSGSVTLPRSGEVVAFDAFTGSLTVFPSSGVANLTTVDIHLVPGSAIVLIVGSPTAWDGLVVLPALSGSAAVVLEPVWSVSLASSSHTKEHWRDLHELRPLSDPDLLPRLSGTVVYTASFDSDAVSGDHCLDLGEVFEIATVRLNGRELGTRIAPPYRFRVPEGVLASQNSIEVEVTNTLAKAQPDFFSAFAQQDPTGLLGPVTIIHS